ncbi:MAG: double-strand break repair helicase AddA [Parvularculaceae bacterium]
MTSAYEKTVATQRNVAGPEISAWVRANAGAGKTKVLTDRVIRLLLTNTPPNKILAITFTKTAAAEMAERLFDRLGEWALMADEDLRAGLTELDPGLKTDSAALAHARLLFARALETPGGLKIQTIHAFCESVLRRFPLEAGISPGFSVLEEETGTSMMAEIIGDLAVNAVNDADLHDSFLRLNQTHTDGTIFDDLRTLSRHWRSIKRAMDEAGSEQNFYQELAQLMGVDLEMSEEQLRVAFLGEIDSAYLESLYSALLTGLKSDNKVATALRIALDGDKQILFDQLRLVFLIGGGTPHQTVPTKKIMAEFPELATKFQELSETYYDCAQAITGYRSFDQMRTLYKLATKAAELYRAEKKRRGFLDFDDQIEATAALFTKHQSAWVLYKLDQGIDHMLVDEAQDTSPAQWDVIKGPLAEFFRQKKNSKYPRTAFVVGDEKQSIYSFQGADVARFKNEETEFHEMVRSADHTLVSDNLPLSFRTSKPVLQLVDEIFDEPLLQMQIGGELGKITHHSNRAQDAGHVELWPLFLAPEREKIDPWDKPLDQVGVESPVRKLSVEIAKTIKSWLEQRRPVASQDRPVEPKDIMILCQTRGAVFHELIRQLMIHDVPTAGADRLKLLEDTAVRDMLAALRFALQPDDDLSLAELLKSPLFSYSDDDLIDLRYIKNETPKTLFGRLKKRAGHAPDGRENKTVRALEQICSAGRLRGPFAFFTHILEQQSPSGWVRFRTRLGNSSDEALHELLTEALTFDTSHPRSLQVFLKHFEGLTTDLKREAGGAENLVRIMTVHGSKGLEANIIFLADAAKLHRGSSGEIVPLCTIDPPASKPLPAPGYYIKLGDKKRDIEAISLARAQEDQRRQEESRRQFYVAMTRARDELYICGHQPGRTGIEKLEDSDPETATWYGLAAGAMDRLRQQGIAQPLVRQIEGQAAIGFSAPQQAKIKKTETALSAPPVLTAPMWLNQPAAQETLSPRILPSRLADKFEAAQSFATVTDDQASAWSPIRAARREEQAENIEPFTRGNVIHTLLEKLPEIDHGGRAEMAHKLIRQYVPSISQNLAQDWVDEVQLVLQDAVFTPLFSPKSRAEVSVVGIPKGAKNKAVFCGQIDRLIVTEETVLIVDYKTNRPPAATAAETSPSYLAQMAAYRALLQEIYPSHKIACALLWTWEPRLMPLPDDLLDHAFVRFIA